MLSKFIVKSCQLEPGFLDHWIVYRSDVWFRLKGERLKKMVEDKKGGKREKERELVNERKNERMDK